MESSWRGKSNTDQKLLETRIGAERVELRIDAEVDDPRAVLPIGRLQHLQGSGVVHEVLNNGTITVIISISGILPECYGDFNDAILVDGPHCNGKSGRARVERVPPCN